MTLDEFDIQFDILYNNISSNAAPGLDAYEKSVFLSQAHKDIVVELYNGRSIPGISFESTEEARAYLKDYIKNFESSNRGNSITEIDLLSDVDKQNPILFRVNEYVSKDADGNEKLLVVPARHDDIINLLKNPFRGPNNSRVLRVDDADGKIILYSNGEFYNYYLTYITKPKPIILKGIEDTDLTIDGVSVTTEGSLGNASEILHSTILKQAVALAKQAYLQ